LAPVTTFLWPRPLGCISAVKLAQSLLLKGNMIGKIDNRFLLEAISPSDPIRKREGVDFHSIVKEKMEEAIPLEKMVLEFLKNALESALSESNRKGINFSSSPSLTSPAIAREALSPARRFPREHRAIGTEEDIESSGNFPAAQDYESLVNEAGRKHGVDPSLIKAVIQVESNGNPSAVSKSGALGLMQLMPETAAQLGVTNPLDPAENIMAGTRYLRMLLDRYRGDLKLALAAYNWGMGNLEKRPEGLPAETKNYILKVENRYRSDSQV
jgi:soluble lytic murein transglycosylase-like protein